MHATSTMNNPSSQLLHFRGYFRFTAESYSQVGFVDTTLKSLVYGFNQYHHRSIVLTDDRIIEKMDNIKFQFCGGIPVKWSCILSVKQVCKSYYPNLFLECQRALAASKR